MKVSDLILIRNMPDSQLIAIALKLAAADFNAFMALHNQDDSNALVLVFNEGYGEVALALTHDQYNDLAKIACSPDKKVNAIKRFREMTGSGLLEAKVLVETMGREGYLNVGGGDDDRGKIRTSNVRPRYREGGVSLGDLLRSQG